MTDSIVIFDSDALVSIFESKNNFQISAVIELFQKEKAYFLSGESPTIFEDKNSEIYKQLSPFRNSRGIASRASVRSHARELAKKLNIMDILTTRREDIEIVSACVTLTQKTGAEHVLVTGQVFHMSKSKKEISQTAKVSCLTVGEYFEDYDA
ncbi:MAG: hypothetical protein U9P68_12065 [Pseudomonadota bacterium]|nr:hypothetical protein [Pseudomonadota bacterium]